MQRIKSVILLSIIFLALLACQSVNEKQIQKSISIYNGLALPISLDINGLTIDMRPHSSANVEVGIANDFIVRAYSIEAEPIETFSPEFIENKHRYFYNVASASAIVEWDLSKGQYQTPHSLGNPRWGYSDADYIMTQTSEMKGTLLSAISNVSPKILKTYISDQSAFTHIISQRTKWDSQDSDYLLSWIYMAGNTPKSKELLEDRLQRFPDEIATVKYILDHSDAKDRTILCEKYQDLATKFIDDGNLFFLNIKCTDNVLERSKMINQAAKKWRHNGWILQSVSALKMDSQDWLAAYDALISAYRQLPILRKTLEVDVERLKRISEAYDYRLTNRLGSQSAEMKALILYETGNSQMFANKIDLAYSLMHSGKLEEVNSILSKEENSNRNLKYLLAASDGMTSSFGQEILGNIVFDEIDDGAFFALTALALRQGNDLSSYYSYYHSLNPVHPNQLKNFVELLQSSKFKKAEALMKGMDVQSRGFFYMMGAVAKRRDIPSDWRKNAIYLLYATERPYLKF